MGSERSRECAGLYSGVETGDWRGCRKARGWDGQSKQARNVNIGHACCWICIPSSEWSIDEASLINRVRYNASVRLNVDLMRRPFSNSSFVLAFFASAVWSSG
jgi:hypothetical protein